MEKSIWKKEIGKNTSAKGLGLCNTVEMLLMGCDSS